MSKIIIYLFLSLSWLISIYKYFNTGDIHRFTIISALIITFLYFFMELIEAFSDRFLND